MQAAQRRQFIRLAAIASGVSTVSPVWAQLNFGKMLEAGKDLGKSETLSDAELKAYFDQMTESMDKQNKVAAKGSPYATRLVKLSAGLSSYDGLKLNFKVYQTPEINAFAMANGTIRIYSGLMDKFSDDEIRYVIGHEIGHVKSGHTKARIQTALRASALRNVAAAQGGKVGALADSQLGDLVEQVVRAQHSQGNEREADDYALKFMKAKRYDAKACASALDKLAALGGNDAGWLSTHPAPKERAERMRSQLA